MRNYSKQLLATVVLFVCLVIPNSSMAQKKGATAPSTSSTPSNNAAPPSSPGGGGGGSGLQGYSFTRSEWEKQLTQVPKASDFAPNLSEKDMVFACYRVAVANNATTPFILENTFLDATPDIPVWQAGHPYTNLSWVYSSHNNGHYYEVQGDGTSGTVEPVFPENGSQVTEAGGTQLVWKDMGKLGYSPFILRWAPQTRYSGGDLVTSAKANGHYYEAQNSGTSGESEPNFRHTKAGQQLAESSGGLQWKDMGDMASHGKHECATVTSAHPFIMNQNLIVVVDMIAVPKEVQKSFTILNFNVTSQAAGSINPTPVQPGISAGTTSLAGGSGPLAATKKEPTNHQLYYLTWPSLISGDTINTINVNIVYTPVAPALPWKQNTFYPAGSIVMSDSGHYYLAVNSGISSADASPKFSSHILKVSTFHEGSGLTWKDLGPTPPSTAPSTWMPGTSYGTGDLVIPPSNKANGHFYRAVAHAQSGATAPGFLNKTHGETFAEGPNLSWTDMGTIPTVAPFPQTSVWTTQQQYSTRDLVTPPAPMINGHYYRAQTSGNSAATAPSFPADRTAVDDGTNLSWADMGPTILIPLPATWSPNTAYAVGATVIPAPPNGHYYEVKRSGVSGPNPPVFPVDGSTMPETQELFWVDSGTTMPSGVKIKRWERYTPFIVGDTIQDDSTGHYYTVTQAGISGGTPPTFAIPQPEIAPESNNQITWQDLGTTLPSSVSTGQPQPSDQTIPVVTYSFPQSHQLSYFTLTSGVVGSSIQGKTFVNTNLPTASSPAWKSFNNGHIVDPILALVVYVKPVDAERAWRFRVKDLFPAPTIAFSLSSPSSNFYFGASSGFFSHNIQLVYGLSLAKINVLQPASLQLSATTPATRSQFATGGFVGISFNILGFITSLPGL
jgi:hypothetical protein